MQLNPRWQHLVCGFPGLLLSGILLAAPSADGGSSLETKGTRRIYLDCITQTSEEYAGVEFKYTIDEANETVNVSRWGEPANVKFGPSYITYRTLGMAMKMAVSINRETWQFTMLHDGGVFVVTGNCKETTKP